MEPVLHYIEELQRMADDLAGGSSTDAARYEEDCELFLVRMEEYVEEKCPVHGHYLGIKLNEVRANMGYLLRQGDFDLSRYQSLVKRGLDGIYRVIKNPNLVEREEEYDV